MPIIVRIPVSSKLIFQRYLTRLIGKMIPISSVVTKITLDQTTNTSGQLSSLFHFETSKMLSPDEADNAKTFGEKFMEIINSENRFSDTKAAS